MFHRSIRENEYLSVALSGHTTLQKYSQILMSASLSDNDLEPRSSGAENDVQSSDCDTSDKGSDIENFLPVLNVIDLDALTSAAIDARRKYDCQKSTIASITSDDVTCVIQTPPLLGSFNLAFVIVFSDDVKWIARVPGSGVSSFGQLEAQRLISSIRTTTLIRSCTSIPIPEVFTWELSRDNPVRVPYHLESFVAGKPLSERWTSQFSGEEPTRIKILRNLAGLMSQLHILPFDRIGSLASESNNAFQHVDAIIRMNYDLDEMFEGGSVWGTVSLFGPFKSTKAYLLAMLDDPKEVPKEQDWTKAELCLLRQAIDSIPRSLDTPQTFSLGHPDFNYQNIFTNDEGEITGLIDWDGVHTLPRALGFARYPSWITRDWDPAKYGYDKPDSRGEDSPAQLLSYRHEYAAEIAGLLLPDMDYSADDTRLSPILEAIEIAVEDTVSRPWIIQGLLEFAFDGIVPFTFPEFSDAWLENQAGDWMDEVRHAFGLMWNRE